MVIIIPVFYIESTPSLAQSLTCSKTRSVYVVNWGVRIVGPYINMPPYVKLQLKKMMIINNIGLATRSVRGAGYEPFDSILCPNRSQKSEEILIRRSSNDVRTLRGQESRRAEFSPTRQHPS